MRNDDADFAMISLMELLYKLDVNSWYEYNYDDYGAVSRYVARVNNARHST